MQTWAISGNSGQSTMVLRVLFPCHGNICRSTMAQFVFQNMVNKVGYSSCFSIDSVATSTEEIGNGPHIGTVRKMREVGVPVLPHKARQITWNDYKSADLVIAMDRENIRNLNRMLKGDPDEKITKLLSFSGLDRDIADPWYTGNFDATYDDIVLGCRDLLEYLKSEYPEMISQASD